MARLHAFGLTFGLVLTGWGMMIGPGTAQDVVTKQYDNGGLYEGTFRDDIGSAQQTLARYFDTKARSTQSVQGLLRQVQANNVTIEVPDLSESLNAVRNYKSKP